MIKVKGKPNSSFSSGQFNKIRYQEYMYIVYIYIYIYMKTCIYMCRCGWGCIYIDRSTDRYRYISTGEEKTSVQQQSI